MDINTIFGYWVKVAPFTGFKITKCGRPSYVGGRETPENLNTLTIGQLIELSELGDRNESVYRVAEIVMGLDAVAVDRSRAVDVVGLVGWVLSEVERINKIFGNIESKHTAAEKRAGVERLKFGLFGMLDWYAVRMGITDHDTVLAVPWLRIYKCMDMDNQRSEYERRLQQVRADEMKLKR